MSILTDAPPEHVYVGGERFAINCDFRVMLRLEELLREDMPEYLRISLALGLFYPRVPDDMHGAIDRLIWFYRCGREPEPESGRLRADATAPYSFKEDAWLIEAAFMEQYGVDLASAALHWWVFQALFSALNESTRFARVVYYRTAKPSPGMSNAQKAHLAAMKQLYALKGGCADKKDSLSARDERLREYVRLRFEDTK